MSQEWIIDVLRDIRHYAHNNRFPGLAEVLDDAMVVAALELHERGEIGSVAERYVNQTGKFHRGAEEHWH